jgi:uncharacterized membrane protein
VDSSFAKEPLIEARLRLTLGTSFWYLGDGASSVKQNERAQSLYAQHLGYDHPDTLRGMSNPNVAFEKMRTGHWERISDGVVILASSQAFTVFHLTWFVTWIGFNLLAGAQRLPFKPFDPFPFGLLTVTVSLEAIFLAIFVLVSQSREAAKDRLQIDLDYQVNLKAQTEIMSIMRKLAS